MKIKEAQKLIKKSGKSFDDFIEWMENQTVAMDEDGETIFFDGDVERFIRDIKVFD